MARKTRFTEWDIPKIRPVRYDGPKMKLDHDIGVDILTLYITCGLGYTPIRHIIGFENDKLIEDVIRQHRLGRSLSRKSDSWKECRLRCPIKSKLDDISIEIIKKISVKHMTEDDPYVQEMIQTRTWKDESYSGVKFCKNCGYQLQSDWDFCPKCQTAIK